MMRLDYIMSVTQHSEATKHKSWILAFYSL